MLFWILSSSEKIYSPEPFKIIDLCLICSILNWQNGMYISFPRACFFGRRNWSETEYSLSTAFINITPLAYVWVIQCSNLRTGIPYLILCLKWCACRGIKTRKRVAWSLWHMWQLIFSVTEGYDGVFTQRFWIESWDYGTSHVFLPPSRDSR